MNMFRDAGDELAHIEDTIRTEGAFILMAAIEMNLSKMSDSQKYHIAQALWDYAGGQVIDEEMQRQLSELAQALERELHAEVEPARSEQSDDSEADEDRLERQAQAHLEAAALHRDDPMF